MSLLDEVRTFEHTVVRRLRELEPLLDEYQQLRSVARRLGIDYAPDEPGAAPASGSRRRARSAAKARTPNAAPAKRAAKRPSRRRASGASSTRLTASPPAPQAASADAQPAKTRAARGRDRKAASARPGRRSDEMLRVVGEQPGVTVREVGERLGVDPTGLYRVANPLAAAGRLRKDGPRLYPIESPASADPEAGETAPTPRHEARADTAAEPTSTDAPAAAAASASTASADAPRPQAEQAAGDRSGRIAAKAGTPKPAAKRSAKTAAKRPAPSAGDAPAAATTAAAATRGAKEGKPGSRGRARPRRIARRGRPADEDVIRLVGEQPGITVPGLSERLKISRPDLYRVTTALTKQGRLRGDGPKLYPAEARAAAPEATAPARAQSQRGPRRTGALAGESAPSNRERRG